MPGLILHVTVQAIYYYGAEAKEPDRIAYTLSNRRGKYRAHYISNHDDTAVEELILDPGPPVILLHEMECVHQDQKYHHDVGRPIQYVVENGGYPWPGHFNTYEAYDIE